MDLDDHVNTLISFSLKIEGIMHIDVFFDIQEFLILVLIMGVYDSDLANFDNYSKRNQ